MSQLSSARDKQRQTRRSNQRAANTRPHVTAALRRHSTLEASLLLPIAAAACSLNFSLLISLLSSSSPHSTFKMANDEYDVSHRLSPLLFLVANVACSSSSKVTLPSVIAASPPPLLPPCTPPVSTAFAHVLME